MSHRSLLLVVAVAAAGCLEVDPPNKPPTASIQVELGGAVLAPTTIMGVTAPAFMITGAGQTVTLRGAGVDPDGRITAYEWWRTDVSRAMRAMPGTTAGTGAAGMGAAGAGGMPAPPPPPPFNGDPPAAPTVEVMLPVVGNYRYSLWVTDDGNLASAPATVTLVVR